MQLAPIASASLVDPDAALRSIQAKGRYVFEASEFAALTGRDPNSVATKAALARLSKTGRITSLVRHPSTWLIVPAEHQHYGAPPVTWWIDDFLRHTDPHHYVALLSAARHWGSAHYAQQTTQVMVARARRPIEVGRLRVVFTYKAALAKTPTVTVTSSVAPYRVSTPEATLLDLIRHCKYIGGLEAIARIAKDFVPAMSGVGLRKALDGLGQAAAAQRLGFILEALGSRLAGTVDAWLTGRNYRREQLEPGETLVDEPLNYHPKWRIAYFAPQLDLVRELA